MNNKPNPVIPIGFACVAGVSFMGWVSEHNRAEKFEQLFNGLKIKYEGRIDNKLPDKQLTTRE